MDTEEVLGLVADIIGGFFLLLFVLAQVVIGLGIPILLFVVLWKAVF